MNLGVYARWIRGRWIHATIPCPCWAYVSRLVCWMQASAEESGKCWISSFKNLRQSIQNGQAARCHVLLPVSCMMRFCSGVMHI